MLYSKALNLAHNQISPLEVVQLAGLLRSCSRLQRLNLAYNQLADAQAESMEPVLQLADTLSSSCRHLTELRLDHCALAARGVLLVLRMCGQLPSLQCVSMANNAHDLTPIVLEKVSESCRMLIKAL